MPNDEGVIGFLEVNGFTQITDASIVKDVETGKCNKIIKVPKDGFLIDMIDNY